MAWLIISKVITFLYKEQLSRQYLQWFGKRGCFSYYLPVYILRRSNLIFGDLYFVISIMCSLNLCIVNNFEIEVLEGGVSIG